MTSEVWLGLSTDERTLLREALAAHGSEAARVLEKRIAVAAPYPDITVGVYGGVVQWVTGNPFPIRICDYDGEAQELPDMDARGQRCTIGFEEPDVALRSNAN